MLSRLPTSWIPLGAILALGAAVRLQHLGALSYDFDEAFSWKMTTFSTSEIWVRAARDNHPPLFFCLLRGWSRLFGDSPGAMRSLNVALGLAAVVGAYLLARRIAGRGSPRGRAGSALRTAVAKALSGASRPHPGPLPEGEGDNRSHPGHSLAGPEGEDSQKHATYQEGEGECVALAAAALVVLSPFHVEFSQQLRMGYVLGAALTTLSCWLLLRALQSPPRWSNYAWYALSAAALAYAHHFALFVLAGQFLYAVGWALQVGDGASADASRPHPGPLPEGERDSRPHPRPFPGDGDRIARPLRALTTERLSHRAAILIAFALIAIAYLPWVPNFLRQRQQVSDLFHTRPFAWQEVAKACYQTLAVRWEDEPPGNAMAWGAAAGYLLPAVAMLMWGRGGLRLVGLCVLLTFDGAICASIADRNIIQSRYFVFANALLLCGVPPLIGQALRHGAQSPHERGARGRFARMRFLMSRIRPHPACLDGEQDGGLAANAEHTHGPIRLVRMVKKIVGCRRTEESYSPSTQVGWGLETFFALDCARSPSRSPSAQGGWGPDARRQNVPFGFASAGVTAMLVAGMAWLCLEHAARREVFARRPGMVGALAYLAECRRPGEPVLVCNPLLQVTAAAHAARVATDVHPASGAGRPHPNRLPEGEGESRRHRAPAYSLASVEGEGEKASEVRVLANRRNFPYFQGTAVMRDDEYLSTAVLMASAARTVWAIDAVDWISPEWTLTLPPPWFEVSEARFPEWAAAENCQIIVRCYRRRDGNRNGTF